MRFGISRLGLVTKCIETAVANALAQLKEGELDAARTIWQKKFGAPPANARDKARQMRFLQGRGFSLDAIRRLLRDIDE